MCACACVCVMPQCIVRAYRSISSRCCVWEPDRSMRPCARCRVCAAHAHETMCVLCGMLLHHTANCAILHRHCTLERGRETAARCSLRHMVQSGAVAQPYGAVAQTGGMVRYGAVCAHRRARSVGAGVHGIVCAGRCICTHRAEMVPRWRAQMARTDESCLLVLAPSRTRPCVYDPLAAIGVRAPLGRAPIGVHRSCGQTTESVKRPRVWRATESLGDPVAARDRVVWRAKKARLNLCATKPEFHLSKRGP
jgi:hypothetical protein